MFTWEILEHITDASQLLTREQHYLDTMHPEYNSAPIAGSCINIEITPIQRARMRAAKLGKKQPLEAVAKRALAIRGRPKPPGIMDRLHKLNEATGHMQRLHDGNRGAKRNEESIARMREAQQRRSPEFWQRLHDHNKATGHMQRLHESNRGSKRSEESIARQRVRVKEQFQEHIIERDRKMLVHLQHDELTRVRWGQLCGTVDGMIESTFYRAVRDIAARGLIVLEKRGKYVYSKLSEAGIQFLSIPILKSGSERA